MKLKYITTDKCPICGTDIIIEDRIEKEIDSFQLKTHVNGECWEHRRFVCGQEIEYIPNYQAEVMSEVYVCNNNEMYKIKIRKQKEGTPALCSLCDPSIKKWHGAFERRTWDGNPEGICNKDSREFGYCFK